MDLSGRFGLAIFLGLALESRDLLGAGFFGGLFQARGIGVGDGGDGGRFFRVLLGGNGDGAFGEPGLDQGVVVFLALVKARFPGPRGPCG